MRRPKVPQVTELEVLAFSRRRCALCFGLEGDISRKRGQIAHLDHDRTNNALDNLAYLCLPHHDEYDTRPSQSKGLQLREVKFHRSALYEAVVQYLNRASIPAESLEQEGEEPVLLAQGELDFYHSQYRSHRDEGLRLLRITSDVMSTFNRHSSEWSTRMQNILAGRAPLRVADAANNLMASNMTTFANELTRSTAAFPLVTTKMLSALARALAVASDLESADRLTFEEKLGDIHGLRQITAQTVVSATAVRGEILGYARGTTSFNRGKRLTLGAIDEHVRLLQATDAGMAKAEEDLRKVLTLF